MQMDKSAGKLNQPFVEGAIFFQPHGQPHFLQDIVRLIIKSAVKELEKAKIVGVMLAALAIFYHIRDSRAFAAHRLKVNRQSSRIENRNLCVDSIGAREVRRRISAANRVPPPHQPSSDYGPASVGGYGGYGVLAHS